MDTLPYLGMKYVIVALFRYEICNCNFYGFYLIIEGRDPPLALVYRVLVAIAAAPSPQASL
jgi:hypothetical protein